MKRLVINNSFHIIHLVSLSYIKTSSQQPPNNFFLSNFLSTQEVEKSPSLSLYSINIVETKDGARGKRSSVHLLKNIDNSDPGFNAVITISSKPPENSHIWRKQWIFIKVVIPPVSS
jgi:hypothetical protein